MLLFPERGDFSSVAQAFLPALFLGARTRRAKEESTAREVRVRHSGALKGY